LLSLVGLVLLLLQLTFLRSIKIEHTFSRDTN
jgi:hypothetical protein